ncbi:hypothetical protein [Terrabacter sp. 2RAF25]|uniref:hypothetical protein n=1 Tax=Terrabacter sp. 2RAF25 TaxID=3232998 RepID=UPI003F998F1B
MKTNNLVRTDSISQRVAASERLSAEAKARIAERLAARKAALATLRDQVQAPTTEQGVREVVRTARRDGVLLRRGDGRDGDRRDGDRTRRDGRDGKHDGRHDGAWRDGDRREGQRDGERRDGRHDGGSRFGDGR